MSEAVSLSLTPDRLRPNSWNTNIVSPENEAKLDEALKRFGFFKPVIVREVDDGFGGTAYEILGGQHRWESAQRVGIKTIPVMNLGVISDTRAQEISLADNSRYGADDSIELAKLLTGLGEDIQTYLPYNETDFQAIFASNDIALDELEFDEDLATAEEKVEPPAAKAPKTHTIMRFQIPILDAERITALITKTQKRQGFTSSNELTNAGDALVHLLFSAIAAEEEDEQGSDE